MSIRFASPVPPDSHNAHNAHNAHSLGRFTSFFAVFYVNRTYSESQNSRVKIVKDVRGGRRIRMKFYRF